LIGNPLAIFTDARCLTDKEVQALARDIRISEIRNSCSARAPSTTREARALPNRIQKDRRSLSANHSRDRAAD